MASLEVRDLVYHHGASDCAFGVEVMQFRLDPGEAVGVVGPSGCGKSTLIDLFSMLLRPSSAQEFRVAGQDVMELWREGGSSACTRLRAGAIGVVLQTGGLLSSLTVWDNVLLSQRLLGRVDVAWALQLLSALDLSGLEKRLPSQLSVGQRQRVAIARSLAHRPGIVFADEPTASIGVEHAPAALALLMRLTQEAGAALLVVSHDLALLREHGIGIARCSMHGSTMRLEK